MLIAAPSETDDAIAAWWPTGRLLYGGPAVIDSVPNVGTPFRTLRDPVRWADSLGWDEVCRRMDRFASLGVRFEPTQSMREVGAAKRRLWM